MKKILLLIMSFSIILVGCGKTTEPVNENTSGSIGDELTYEEFDIKLDDAYYSNFPHDGIEIKFDRYLAADFIITNNSDETTVAKALTSFTVVDDNGKLSRVMVDENRKKFSANLMPGESFEITVVFPVMDSSSYTIYYSYGATTNKENVLSWTFDLDNKKYEEVEKTVEHRDVKDVVETFLLGDGSNETEFEYKPASNDEEEDSQSEDELEETSEVSSEVR